MAVNYRIGSLEDYILQFCQIGTVNYRIGSLEVETSKEGEGQ